MLVCDNVTCSFGDGSVVRVKPGTDVVHLGHETSAPSQCFRRALLPFRVPAESEGFRLFSSCFRSGGLMWRDRHESVGDLPDLCLDNIRAGEEDDNMRAGGGEDNNMRAGGGEDDNR